MNIENRIKYILRLVSEEYNIKGLVSYKGYKMMYNTYTFYYTLDVLDSTGITKIEKCFDVRENEIRSLDTLYLIIRESLIPTTY